MYRKDSPPTIQSMFNSIAKRYDRTNAILSFSLHKIWNRTLVRQLLKRHPSPHVLIDLCSGTGDIAFEFLKQATVGTQLPTFKQATVGTQLATSKQTTVGTQLPTHVYLIDFSSEMLAFAKQKRGSIITVILPSDFLY